MRHTTNIAAVIVAAGLVLAGCATTPSNAPDASSAPPGVSSTPPQVTALTWATSMCQALNPALRQLGTPPQPDVHDLAATRQAFVAYLTNAANTTQQAIDRLSSIGAPPVPDGQQILEQVRTQLVQLRTNLTDVATQLKDANPNDSTAIGQAISAAGNVVGLIGALGTNPQLRAAIDQAPECQNLTIPNGQ